MNFDTLYQVLRTLQTNMKQNSAGVDVSGKWFFDRFSPVTNIKAVGNADVTYGLAIEQDQITRKEITLKNCNNTMPMF